MISLKSNVLRALEADPVLFALLEGRIWHRVVPEKLKSIFPRITFFELTNLPEDYADDQAISTLVHFQVDIWHLSSTTRIAQEVNRVMEELDFVRSSTADMYEEDTKIYHYALRFTGVFEI